MIDTKQFREIVVKPTLLDLGLWSQSAENLLMGTFAQESRCGTYIKQLGDGPALGVYQMEPATHDDIWRNFINYRNDMRKKVINYSNVNDIDSNLLVYNIRYATAMARLHYYRVPDKLPDAEDTEGLARYWKKHYNTELGKGTIAEFVHNYRTLLK